MPLLPNLIIEGQKKAGQRTDWFSVLPPSTATAATLNSGYFTNPYSLGVWINVIVSNLSGTPTFTPSFSIAGAYGTDLVVWTAASAIAANGSFNYLSHVSTFTSTAVTERFLFPITRYWKFTLTFGGTGTADTQVIARYI